jgi:hypothetical protein
MKKSPSLFIKWFSDITIDDVPLVGGKNASLGEMVREPDIRPVYGPGKVRRSGRILSGCAGPVGRRQQNWSGKSERKR